MSYLVLFPSCCAVLVNLSLLIGGACNYLIWGEPLNCTAKFGIEKLETPPCRAWCTTFFDIVTWISVIDDLEVGKFKVIQDQST